MKKIVIQARQVTRKRRASLILNQQTLGVTLQELLLGGVEPLEEVAALGGVVPQVEVVPAGATLLGATLLGEVEPVGALGRVEPQVEVVPAGAILLGATLPGGVEPLEVDPQ